MKKNTQKKVQAALLAMPVSINCYYGDPTLQWEDTISKLRHLAEVGHTGPVSVITRGSIGPARAKELVEINLPGLVVMYSISELPKELEPLGHEHRYKSIGNLINAGVKVFAAVRPMTPPYNTSPEVVNRIFAKLQAAGCEVACVSGFRGDASLVEQVNPDNAIEWTLRVKQMTGFDMILETAKAHGVRMFTRVNCAVSYLTGRETPFNPYWGSPQLVRCDAIECPLRGTCGPVEPDEDLLDWLREAGYDVEYEPASQAACGYSSDTRLNCVSCCTTCFVQKQPRVLVHNAETLGDLTFCRFVLGGTLCIKPGMIDSGDKNVGHVTKIQNKTGFQVHAINSWFVWANQLNKCFDCKFCVSGLYPNKGPIGCAPVELLKFFPGKENWMVKFKSGQPACPGNCKYCVVTETSRGRTIHNKGSLLSINKACTIVQVTPWIGESLREEGKFLNFPWEILKGDIVGGTAVTDFFWPKLDKYLQIFLERASLVAKIVTCVTKWPLSRAQMELLSRYPNFRLVVSITGNGVVEQFTVKQHLNTLALAKEFGVKAFPLVHPYIAGVSNLSFLSEVKKLGYDSVDLKGFRFDTGMLSWLPQESAKYYIGFENQEVLPEDGWREKIEEAELSLLSLKKWYQKDAQYLQPKLSQEDAEKLVTQVFELANVTSSSSSEEVFKASIERRL